MHVFLDKPSEIRPRTLRDAAEHVWSHAYHDQKRMDRNLYLSAALGTAAFFATGIAAATSENPTEAANTWLSLSLGGIALTLGYIVYEGRRKLSYLRDTFRAAAGGTDDITTALSEQFAKTLFTPRPSITDYVGSLRKYPIQTCAVWLGAAATLATSSGALLALSAAMVSWMVLQEEQGMAGDISDAARKAMRRVDFYRKNPEVFTMLRDKGQLTHALERGVIDQVINGQDKPILSSGRRPAP